MSPKPVDVPRALSTLRSETPTSEQTESILRALDRPAPRRSLARPLALTMTATAVALALVFAPRSPRGSAWAQTLASSFDAVTSHSVSYETGGKVGMEEWREGRKRAHVLYNRKGTPMMEWRDNGEHFYNYAGDMFTSDAPNARRWGAVYRSVRPGMMYEVPYGSPEELLKQPGVEVLAHREAKDGKPESYAIRVPGLEPNMIKQPATVEVRDGRIVRIRWSTLGNEVKIDYPASIPDGVFDPRPQTIRGVDVYDLEKTGTALKQTLRKGLGKSGPVTLRAVLMTGPGELWAFWTGALPDPGLKRPFSIPGVPCGKPFTTKLFTKAWEKSPTINGLPKPVSGERLGGMARVPSQRLGSTVNLDIPYKGGVAHFRNVPITRIGIIQHVDDVLGVERQYR